MVRNTFVAGFLSCLILVGCAGWSIKYYALEGVRYEEGMLQAAKPKDDLPFEACRPGADGKRKCVVMFSAEFFSLKADYQDCKMRLTECERYKNTP